MRKLVVIFLCLMLTSCYKQVNRTPVMMNSNLPPSDIEADEMVKIPSYTNVYKKFVSWASLDECKGIHFTENDIDRVISIRGTILCYSWGYTKRDKSYFLGITDFQYYGFYKTFKNPTIRKLQLNETDFLIDIIEH